MQRALFLIAVAAVVLGCDLQARADNLVTNGGFETGDFTGWTTHPATSGSDFGVNAENPHSGMYAAVFEGSTPGDYDGISQTLTTVAGDIYDVSFWLDTTEDNQGFQALWDGSVIYDNSAAGTDMYVNIVLTETGTGSDILTFQGYNVPFVDSLDDVSVSTITAVVPEPVGVVLLGTGMAGVAGRLRRRFRRA